MKVIDLKPDAELMEEIRDYFPHMEARKFQADLANNIYALLADGERNIVVEAPTGLGKALEPPSRRRKGREYDEGSHSTDTL